MSDFCVMLVLKTVIYKSKLLAFQTAQALNPNIIVQTLDIMDELCLGWLQPVRAMYRCTDLGIAHFSIDKVSA